MAVALRKTEPIEPDERETQDTQKLDALLESPEGLVSRTKLIAPTGEELILPASAYKILHQAVHLLARGHAVAIVPYEKLLTTQQAADLLNVSRPHLVQLLESGKIQFQMVGSHRRVRFDHLMEFRSQRDNERRKRLNKLTELSYKYGMSPKRKNK